MNALIRPQTVAAQVAALPKMSMKELWSLWDKYFQRRPSHHNRGSVEARVAYKMQEEAFGGLKPEVRSQLIDVGRIQAKNTVRRVNDIRIVPGTVLIREFDNHDHRVIALADGSFDYEGERFKSLSAVARFITGSRWSGPVFFGLVKTERRAR